MCWPWGASMGVWQQGSWGSWIKEQAWPRSRRNLSDSDRSVFAALVSGSRHAA